MLEACSIDKKDTGVFLSNERKTKWVTLISLFTMIVEIVVGYWSGSMALLADGWHMASHTLALFLSLVVFCSPYYNQICRVILLCMGSQLVMASTTGS